MIKYATKQEAGVKQERKSTVVEAEIKRIYTQYGTINAELLLQEATSPTSPIHKYFEWDDVAAAHRHRLQQATNMLVTSKFLVTLKARARGPSDPAVEQSVRVRQLVSVYRGEGFVMRKSAMKQADMREALVAKKIQALRHWCDEAIDFPELRKIRNSILKLLPPK